MLSLAHDLADVTHVHVLVPYTRVGPRGHLSCPYYDTREFRTQIGRWFEALGMPWSWHAVSFDNLQDTLREIARDSDPRRIVIFNLCDGTEQDGYPGLSVTSGLEASGLAYTGGDPAFYALTTCKLRTKTALMARGVPTAPFLRIEDVPQDIARAATLIGYPLIVKPAVGYGGRGISVMRTAADSTALNGLKGQRDVVSMLDPLLRRASVFPASLRRWLHAAAHLLPDSSKRMIKVAQIRRFIGGGLFAERFIVGREFKVYVVGSARHGPPPRVFFARECQFLPRPTPKTIFVRGHESDLIAGRALGPGERNKSASTPVPPELSQRLEKLCREAFQALDATGYASVDVRMEENTGAFYVLEVNSNCGLSDQEMLDDSGQSMTVFVAELLREARARQAVRRAHTAGSIASS